MSAQLDKIREIKGEMYNLAKDKMKNIKRISFNDEYTDDVTYVLVSDKYGTIHDLPVKEIWWDEDNSLIKVDLFDSDWGTLNLWEILDCGITWLYDTIIDY